MKVGFIGGGILLILTLVFSVIAIQNNKLARTIVISEFNNSKQPSALSNDLEKFNSKFNAGLDNGFEQKFDSASKNILKEEK